MSRCDVSGAAKPPSAMRSNASSGPAKAALLPSDAISRRPDDESVSFALCLHRKHRRPRHRLRAQVLLEACRWFSHSANSVVRQYGCST